MLVGEIVSDESNARSMEYCAPGRLNMAYNVLFLQDGELSAKRIRRGMESRAMDLTAALTGSA